jgi:hypothetical protein
MSVYRDGGSGIRAIKVRVSKEELRVRLQLLEKSSPTLIPDPKYLYGSRESG